MKGKSETQKGGKDVARKTVDREHRDKEQKGGIKNEHSEAGGSQSQGRLPDHHSPEPGRWAPAGADSPPAGL